MGKTKSHYEYAAEIEELWNAGETGDKLWRKVEKWAERVPLHFFVASNEQKPYTAEELGYPCESMPLKKETGVQQTGDYHCYLPDYDCHTGLIWERKELSDFYSTLVHGRDRFFRECQRAVDNPSIDYMMIGIEGTSEKFMKYKPAGSPGAHPAARAGMVEGLQARFNYQVIPKWHSNRNYAIKGLIKNNRMWIKYHFATVLDLTGKENKGVVRNEHLQGTPIPSNE
jgi:hypothetical protein